MPRGIGERQATAQIALETHACVQIRGGDDLAEIETVKRHDARDRGFAVEIDIGRFQPHRSTGAFHQGFFQRQMIAQDLEADIEIGQGHPEFGFGQVDLLARRRMQRRQGIEDDLAGQALRRTGGAEEAHADAIGRGFGGGDEIAHTDVQHTATGIGRFRPVERAVEAHRAGDIAAEDGGDHW